MMPTLNEMGDVVLVDKLSPGPYGWNPISRNDVVIAESNHRYVHTAVVRGGGAGGYPVGGGRREMGRMGRGAWA